MVKLEASFVNGTIRGTIRDGFGNTDTVIDIERVEGTRFGDNFVGSRADNAFWGAEGKDTYNGLGGRDRLDFGRTFTDADQHGIQVDLSRTTGQIIDDGFGNVETALNVEQISATGMSDRLKGSTRAEILEGMGSTDTLTGGGGNDQFLWYSQQDAGNADRVTDFKPGDRLTFRVDEWNGMTDTVRIVNGTQATTNQGTFLFNAATDTLTWDSNGTGAGGRTVVAELVNVNSLSATSFELWT